MLFGDAPSRVRRITQKNDVIISTVRTYLKAVALIEQNGLIVSTGFDVLTPKRNICSKFLYYLCICDFFISNVESKSLGVSYPAITEYNIGCLLIPTPLSPSRPPLPPTWTRKPRTSMPSLKNAKLR